MKIKTCVRILLLVFFNLRLLNAQIKQDTSKIYEVRNLLKFKFNLNNVGPEWEQKISKNSSINFFAGLLLSTNTDGFSFSNFRAKWSISPDIHAEYRNYYNIHWRHEQNKKTINNSANFLFCRLEGFLPVKHKNFFNLLFFQGWGAQRSLSDKLSIECHLGVTEHFYYDKPPHGGFNYIYIEPSVSIFFNYVF